MPEGPEVRRVFHDMLSEITGNTVVEMNILGGRFLKKAPVGFDGMVYPATLVNAGVRGKFMWFRFNETTSMWITLGMSGTWSTEPNKHAHFEIKLSNGKSLYFVDPRRFGTIRFSHDLSELDKKLASMGMDLLNDGIDTINLVRSKKFGDSLSKHRNKTVAELLMNQSVLAGVGNYIKCEALYACKVSPFAVVGKLSTMQMLKIFKTIRKIMHDSYQQGGATIRDYKRVNGDSGNFAFSFKVYGKKTDPLGNEVIREKTFDGRTTHWVPSEQS